MADSNVTLPGADVAQDALKISQDAKTLAQNAAELTSGNINVSIESVSRRGDRETDGECPPFTQYHRKVMHLTHRTLLQRLIRPPAAAVRLSIGVRWQGNGCDVVAATPYLGSGSMAGYGTSVTGAIRAVKSAVGRPQETCDCCESAACAEFSVSLVIDPMIGNTVIKSGHIIVCANGEVGAEWQ